MINGRMTDGELFRMWMVGAREMKNPLERRWYIEEVVSHEFKKQVETQCLLEGLI